MQLVLQEGDGCTSSLWWGARKAFDPYGTSSVSIVLDGSDPFGRPNDGLPAWHLSFLGPTEEITTWVSVFEIDVRFPRDYLDPGYRWWLKLFRDYAKAIGAQPTATSIIQTLAHLESLFAMMLFDEKNFLKVAVFRMLRVHCENGNHRLVRELADLLTT